MKLIVNISNRQDSLLGTTFVPVFYSHQHPKYKMKGNKNEHIPLKQFFLGAWRAGKPEVGGRLHPDNARAPALQV